MRGVRCEHRHIGRRLALTAALALALTAAGPAGLTTAGSRQVKPPVCHNPLACKRLRYELFLATVTVRQTTTWHMPRGSEGASGECFENFDSGSGTQVLTYATGPTTATFVRGGAAYAVGFNGHYDRGHYVARSDLPAQGTLTR